MFKSFLTGIGGFFIRVIGSVLLLFGLVAKAQPDSPAGMGTTLLVVAGILLFVGFYLRYLSRHTVRIKN